MRKSNLFRMFQSALLAALLIVPLAAAHAQPAAPASAAASAKVVVPPTGGQRAFWCKAPNGVAALQLESCAPGTELRSEPVGPHGRVNTPPPVPLPTGPTADAPAPRAPAAARPAAPVVEEAAKAPAGLPGRSALKQGLLWIFLLAGLGLAAGLVGRQMERPFWRSAMWGGAVWIVLLLAVKLIF